MNLAHQATELRSKLDHHPLDNQLPGIGRGLTEQDHLGQGGRRIEAEDDEFPEKVEAQDSEPVEDQPD